LSHRASDRSDYTRKDHPEERGEGACRPGVTPAAIRCDGARTASPPCGAGRIAAASPVASRRRGRHASLH